MKAYAQESQGFEPTTTVCYDTKQFVEAKLLNGELQLTMKVHQGPVFTQDFLEHLSEMTGKDCDLLADQAIWELNRQIMIRMLLK